MKIAVWDTYVKRGDGKIMHFDILVPNTLKNENLILDFGNSYLNNKSFQSDEITTKECQFCHIEEATENIKEAIESKGYYILEMENCQ